MRLLNEVGRGVSTPICGTGSSNIVVLLLLFLSADPFRECGGTRIVGGT